MPFPSPCWNVGFVNVEQFKIYAIVCQVFRAGDCWVSVGVFALWLWGQIKMFECCSLRRHVRRSVSIQENFHHPLQVGIVLPLSTVCVFTIRTIYYSFISGSQAQRINELCKFNYSISGPAQVLFSSSEGSHRPGDEWEIISFRNNHRPTPRRGVWLPLCLTSSFR